MSTTVDEDRLRAAGLAHGPGAAGRRGTRYDDRPRVAERVALTPDADPVPRWCVANLDSLEAVSIGSLMQRIGWLSDERMHGVCAALAVALDC